MKRRNTAMGGTASKDTASHCHTPSAVPEDNGFRLHGVVVPEQVLIQLLVHLPSHHLLTSAMLVCKYWRLILSDPHFWRTKLAVDGVRLSTAVEARLQGGGLGVEEELRLLQCICLAASRLPFNTNLIRNSSGQDGFQHWKVKRGGERTVIECPPVGSDPIPEEAGLPTQHCFVSSYGMSSREQIIDLSVLGFTPFIMDTLRPAIHVSEWVSARFDCHSMSNMMVKLQGSHSGAEVRKGWTSEQEDIILTHWYQLKEVITDYPERLHKITFTNCSKDLQYWAGNYGAKTAGSCVMLVL